MRVNDFYQLIDQGKFSEASLCIKSLKGDDRIESELVTVVLQLSLFGGVDQVSSLVKDLGIKTRENPLLQSLARACLALVFMWEAKHSEAHIELEEAQHLIENYPAKDKFNVPSAFVPFMKAFYMAEMGKHDAALPIYSQILQIASADEFPLKSLAIAAYNNRGSIYELKGEWTRAIESHLKGMQISEETGNEILRSYPLIKLGNLYHLQGMVELATDKLEKGLDNSRKYQDKRGITWALKGLGSIYHTKGKYELAQQVFLEALRTIKNAKLAASDLSSTLYLLCLLYIDMGNPTQAKKYLRELQDHALHDTSLRTQMLSLFVGALILKNSKRFKDKGQAQEQFQAIFESKKTREKTRFLAMLHFCDLLLQEVQMSEDEMIFQRAQVVAENLYDLAQSWQFTPEIVNTLVLRSKFAQVEGDAHLALDMLEKAQTKAKEEGLTNLSLMVEGEQKKMRRELKRWQDLTDMNTSLKERIQLTEIESYLKDAIEIRDRTLELP